MGRLDHSAWASAMCGRKGATSAAGASKGLEHWRCLYWFSGGEHGGAGEGNT